MSYVATNPVDNTFGGCNFDAVFDTTKYEATDAEFDTCTADTPDTDAGSVHTTSTGFVDDEGGRINLTELVTDVMAQAAKLATNQMTAALKVFQQNNSGADINGLRSQIQANALVLLPMLKPGEDVTFYNISRKAIIPDVMVEYVDPAPGCAGVIIQASVVYQSCRSFKQQLVKGAAANTVVRALEDLLDVTMQLLAHMPKVNKAAELADRSPTAQEFKMPGGGSYYFEHAIHRPFGPGDTLWWGSTSPIMLGVPMPPKKNVMDLMAPRIHHNFGPDPIAHAQRRVPGHVVARPGLAPNRRVQAEYLRSPTPQAPNRAAHKTHVTHGPALVTPITDFTVNYGGKANNVRGTQSAAATPNAPSDKTDNSASSNYSSHVNPTMEEQHLNMIKDFNNSLPTMKQAGLIKGLNGALPNAPVPNSYTGYSQYEVRPGHNGYY